jgi:hypothetical protein
LLKRGLPHKEIAARLLTRRGNPMSLATETAILSRVRLCLGLSTVADIVRWACTHPGAVHGELVPRDLHPDDCPCEAPFCTDRRWDVAREHPGNGNGASKQQCP